MRSVAPRHATVLLLAAGLAGCGAPVRPPTGPGSSPAIVLPETVRVRAGGEIRAVPLEDYVVDAILSEVSPVETPPEAVARIFDIQAVVARTYAVSSRGRHRADGFDLCATTHCQLYEPARRRSSRFAAAAVQAASRTRGQVLVYGGRTIEAVFHADCGGVTAPSDAVWGGAAVPYLRAVVDDVPAAAHRPWHAVLSVDTLRDALNGDARTMVGRRLEAIDILVRDASGRAASLGLRGDRVTTVRGDVLRAVVNQRFGDRTLPSTRFTLRREGRYYRFEGLGLGHGVGLCQRGAAARVSRGEGLGTILQTYYPGARLMAALTGAPRP